MGNSSNRIVAAVFAVLAVGVIALAMSSGSCSGGGGGSSGSSGAGAASGETIDYDITTDGLRELLDDYDVPVGSNARQADSAQDVLTASEAYAAFHDRGFADVGLEADFNADGTLREEASVSASSTDRCPSYRAMYESSSGVLWLVYLNGSSWLAVPMGDGTQATAASLIFTEGDVVTQYDGTRNQFSDFALDELDDAKGIKIDRVDAATLNGYTVAELGKM